VRTLPTIAAAAAVATGVLCLGGVALMPLAASMGAATLDPDHPVAAQLTSCGQPTTTPATTPQVPGYTTAQTANAAAIVRTGQQQHVPPRGWVIAIATAMQESNLHNSSEATDHDSVGLFQQRPSQGWGTVTQIMDPQYAARKFYELVGCRGRAVWRPPPGRRPLPGAVVLLQPRVPGARRAARAAVPRAGHRGHVVGDPYDSVIIDRGLARVG
jgi:hypothetical protein